MATNTTVDRQTVLAARHGLVPVRDGSRLGGFGNMLGKELGDWFGTRQWIVQAIIWLLIINGLMAFIMFIVPVIDSSQQMSAEEELTQGLGLYFNFAILFGAVGMIILAQDEIIQEKQSGTAAWILSKPVSRSAFVLSKLVAHSLGFLFTIIVVPGLVAYLEASAAGIHITTAGFLSGLALLFLHLLFYLTLTVMLGTFFRSTTPVIGIPFLLLFLQMGLTEFIGLGAYLPGAIPFIAPAVMQGEPLVGLVPVGTAAGFSVLFSIVAIWRFRREEF